MEKLLLLDSNSLLHRAYYALPGLTDSKGNQYFYRFLKDDLRIRVHARAAYQGRKTDAYRGCV